MHEAVAAMQKRGMKVTQLTPSAEAEWRTLSGTRLYNSGNWYLESAFVRGEDSPYWPGTIAWTERGAPLRLENALRSA